MGDLFLKQEKLNNSTTVPNFFIDQYMPSANGEFVKVYIHLLRCASRIDADLSLEKLADTFTCTERDVTRALRYWENLGLLTLTTDTASHKIKGISLEECKANASIKIPRVVTTDLEEREPVSVVSDKEKPQYTVDEINTFKSNEDVAQLIYIAEAYMGKTLSSQDTNTILYFYDTLGFPIDLIEYLIEYCVNNKKKRMRYIEAVALEWAKEGILTVEQAKVNTCAYSKEYYPIMKSMGIMDRSPGQNEKDYIVKWNHKLGFSTDIIIEACNRTIDTIHKPDFRYANSILENWKKSGISSIDEIHQLDQEHKNRQLTRKLEKKGNVFTNFDQHSYDYEELERKMLASRK